jgi:hypothetical protein
MMMSKFHPLWQWWKRIARKIGDAQARIILTLFYFLVVGPFALIIRFWSDPLRLHSKTPGGWIRKSEAESPAAKRAREQF